MDDRAVERGQRVTPLELFFDLVFAIPALGLCGGVALYLLAHVALRLRIGGGLGRGRPVATILLLGLLPLAREVPSPRRARAGRGRMRGPDRLRGTPLPPRAWIRSRRGAFTMEEAARVARTRGRPRHRRA